MLWRVALVSILFACATLGMFFTRAGGRPSRASCPGERREHAAGGTGRFAEVASD
jgi:hypothetical protein